MTTNPPELLQPTAFTRTSKAAKTEVVWGYFFVSPVLVGIVVFSVFPVIYSLFLSFTAWDGTLSMKFVGLQNLVSLFSDSTYDRALLNTVMYTLGTVPITTCLSVLLAVFVNMKIRGVVFYRTIYFLPSVTMTIAIAVVWRWLFNGDYGLLNFLLSLLRIHGPDWLSDEHYIMPSIMIVSIWGGLGYNMVLLLAGLQSISSTYYEAAAIDGAGGVRQFFRITLPLLSPSIFFVLVTSLIGAFQIFDLIFMMGPSAANGPNSVLMQSTRTVVYYIYETGFNWFRFGYASAQAWVLFIIILIVTAIQLKLQQKWVHYE